MALSWGDKIFAFHGDAVLQISRYGIQNKLRSNALPQKTFSRDQLSPHSYFSCIGSFVSHFCRLNYYVLAIFDVFSLNRSRTNGMVAITDMARVTIVTGMLPHRRILMCMHMQLIQDMEIINSKHSSNNR